VTAMLIPASPPPHCGSPECLIPDITAGFHCRTIRMTGGLAAVTPELRVAEGKVPGGTRGLSATCRRRLRGNPSPFTSSDDEWTRPRCEHLDYFDPAPVRNFGQRRRRPSPPL